MDFNDNMQGITRDVSMAILGGLNIVNTLHIDACFLMSAGKKPYAQEFCDFKNDLDLFTKMIVSVGSGKWELIWTLCPIARDYNSIFIIILSSFRFH